MKKPLTPKILSDPTHNFVKTLVYIYTMETFLYKELNKASRTKDLDKIKFYGPFASALSFAIHCGNKQQSSLQREFSVYRGLPISTEELNQKYKLGSTLNLKGFTSTTLLKIKGIEYAFGGDPSKEF